MFVNQSTEPSPDWPGLIFKFEDWIEVIPDSPTGIWIEGDLISQNLVLRERTQSGVIYRFVVHEPSIRTASDAMTRPLHDTTSQSKPGYVTGITLFAEVVEDSPSVFELIEQAIATKEDPPALLDTAQQIMTDGFNLSCEFINILCQEFDQYWLHMPDPSCLEVLIILLKASSKVVHVVAAGSVRLKSRPSAAKSRVKDGLA